MFHKHDAALVLEPESLHVDPDVRGVGRYVLHHELAVRRCLSTPEPETLTRSVGAIEWVVAVERGDDRLGRWAGGLHENAKLARCRDEMDVAELGDCTLLHLGG